MTAKQRTRDGGRSRQSARPSESSKARGASARATPNTGAGVPKEATRAAKRTVMDVMKDIPNYLKLFTGLLSDPRVPTLDKILVAGAIAYVVMPVDWIPDFIPFLGEVDDVFLLVTALQRLVSNAGRRVVLSHWAGAPDDIGELNLSRIVAAASLFLPRRIRRRLRMVGRDV